MAQRTEGIAGGAGNEWLAFECDVVTLVEGGEEQLET